MPENEQNLGRQEESEQPIYRPLVEFSKGDLFVTFDHALKANQTELASFPWRGQGARTSFIVRPDQELYVGLHFISPRIISEVERGLASYLEQDDLSDEQKSLISIGVKKLSEFFRRNGTES